MGQDFSALNALLRQVRQQLGTSRTDVPAPPPVPCEVCGAEPSCPWQMDGQSVRLCAGCSGAVQRKPRPGRWRRLRCALGLHRREDCPFCEAEEQHRLVAGQAPPGARQQEAP
jgi:hypothetical protein